MITNKQIQQFKVQNYNNYISELLSLNGKIVCPCGFTFNNFSSFFKIYPDGNSEYYVFNPVINRIEKRYHDCQYNLYGTEYPNYFIFGFRVCHNIIYMVLNILIILFLVFGFATIIKIIT